MKEELKENKKHLYSIKKNSDFIIDKEDTGKILQTEPILETRFTPLKDFLNKDSNKNTKKSQTKKNEIECNNYENSNISSIVHIYNHTTTNGNSSTLKCFSTKVFTKKSTTLYISDKESKNNKPNNIINKIDRDDQSIIYTKNSNILSENPASIDNSNKNNNDIGNNSVKDTKINNLLISFSQDNNIFQNTVLTQEDCFSNKKLDNKITNNTEEEAIYISNTTTNLGEDEFDDENNQLEFFKIMITKIIDSLNSLNKQKNKSLYIDDINETNKHIFKSLFYDERLYFSLLKFIFPNISINTPNNEEDLNIITHLDNKDREDKQNVFTHKLIINSNKYENKVLSLMNLQLLFSFMENLTEIKLNHISPELMVLEKDFYTVKNLVEFIYDLVTIMQEFGDNLQEIKYEDMIDADNMNKDEKNKILQTYTNNNLSINNARNYELIVIQDNFTDDKNQDNNSNTKHCSTENKDNIFAYSNYEFEGESNLKKCQEETIKLKNPNSVSMVIKENFINEYSKANNQIIEENKDNNKNSNYNALISAPYSKPNFNVTDSTSNNEDPIKSNMLNYDKYINKKTPINNENIDNYSYLFSFGNQLEKENKQTQDEKNDFKNNYNNMNIYYNNSSIDKPCKEIFFSGSLHINNSNLDNALNSNRESDEIHNNRYNRNSDEQIKVLENMTSLATIDTFAFPEIQKELKLFVQETTLFKKFPNLDKKKILDSISSYILKLKLKKENKRKKSLEKTLNDNIMNENNNNIRKITANKTQRILGESTFLSKEFLTKTKEQLFKSITKYTRILKDKDRKKKRLLEDLAKNRIKFRSFATEVSENNTSSFCDRLMTQQKLKREKSPVPQFSVGFVNDLYKRKFDLEKTRVLEECKFQNEIFAKHLSCKKDNLDFMNEYYRNQDKSLSKQINVAKAKNNLKSADMIRRINDYKETSEKIKNNMNNSNSIISCGTLPNNNSLYNLNAKVNQTQSIKELKTDNDVKSDQGNIKNSNISRSKSKPKALNSMNNKKSNKKTYKDGKNNLRYNNDENNNIDSSSNQINPDKESNLYINTENIIRRKSNNNRNKSINNKDVMEKAKTNGRSSSKTKINNIYTVENSFYSKFKKRDLNIKTDECCL